MLRQKDQVRFQLEDLLDGLLAVLSFPHDLEVVERRAQPA
jgi:hypothetical protein